MKQPASFIALFASAATSLSADPQVQTATTHPMKYLVSLPANWTPDRRWPVLVAPSAHYDAGGKSLAQFAAERDARHADLIIVAPFVINADPIKNMPQLPERLRTRTSSPWCYPRHRT